MKKVLIALSVLLMLFCRPLPLQAGTLEEKAQQSMDAAMEDMHIKDFLQTQDVDGNGVTVAVLDTGIDAAHPAFTYTRRGYWKIADWADMTDEGMVQLTGQANIADKNIITTDQGQYSIANIGTKSGQVYFGFLQEANLPQNSPCRGDLNQDGAATDTYMVLLTDPNQAGKYDTVWVDADDDHSFNGEKPLKLFSVSHSYSIFNSKTKQGVSFVLAAIDSQGKSVKLGFDGNGHGTQVAGIIGAYGKPGAFTGVAPGAQLMAVKVANSAGETDWDTIRRGIEYAAQHGARIINLSIGSREDALSGSQLQAKELAQVANKYNVIFVCAVGNDGPFFGSLSSPADADCAIAVGGYLSQKMKVVNQLVGSNTADIFYYTSRGPRADGKIKPNVVGPAAVMSAAPAWTGSLYQLGEGSSAAASFISGVSALLAEGADRLGLVATQQTVQYALEQSARMVDGYTMMEQGNGVVDVPAAFQLLLQTADYEPLKTRVLLNDKLEEALYLEDEMLGAVPAVVKNSSGKPEIFNLYSTESWLGTLEKRLLLPAGSQRQFTMKSTQELDYGSYTGRIEGFNAATGLAEITADSTVVKPYEYDGQSPVEIEGSLLPGKISHYFFLVPEGTKHVDFKLSVHKAGGGFDGRVRMHIASPDLRQTKMTEFAGQNPAGTQKESVEASFASPSPGLWQVVVYSSAVTSLEQSYFTLSSDAEVPEGAVTQLSAAEGKDPASAISVFLSEKTLVQGEPAYLTLKVRDKAKKQLLNAWAEINGSLYYVDGGILTFPVKPEGEKFDLAIKITVSGYQELNFNYSLPVATNGEGQKTNNSKKLN